MTITVGYWETRDGRKARVLCTDAPGEYPVKGYIEDGRGESYSAAWSLDGCTLSTGGPANHLIRPWVDRPVIDWSKEREWVKAMATDGGGTWFRYSKVPNQGLNCWHDGGWSQRMHLSECPQFTGSWKDSLCVRPEGGGQ